MLIQLSLLLPFLAATFADADAGSSFGTTTTGTAHAMKKKGAGFASSSSSSGRIKAHDWEHLGLTAPTAPTDPNGRVRCAMPEPTEEKILHDNFIVQDYVQNHRQRHRRAQDGEIELIVPTCFHVVRPEGDADPEYLNAAMIQDQLDVLNQGFSSTSCCDTNLFWCEGECSLETGIRFTIAEVDSNDPSQLTGFLVDSATSPNACITRTENNDWYNSEALTPSDTAMRRNLRLGGPEVLNIFYKGGESGLSGIAQFPSDYATQSVTDAVLVGDVYVKGGGDADFGEGDTLTHEVGHWMGLFHTFQDGCQGGDRIGDTPAEKSSAFGCQVGRNTCLGMEGNDPIHNFMDYSDDHCLFEFTENQVARMKAQHRLYRSGLRQDIAISNGVSVDAFNMFRYEIQNFVLTTAPGSRVECISSAAQGGDVDMYMRDGAAPVLSTNSLDCFSEGSNSAETCSILANSGTAYVSIYAFKRTDGIVLTCTGEDFETAIQLMNGVFSAPFNLAPLEEKAFTLLISDPGARAVCFLNIQGAPVDGLFFYLRFNQPPDVATGDIICEGSLSRRCAVRNPGDGTVLWATVTSSIAVPGVSIGCFSSVPEPPIMIEPNIPSSPILLDAYEAQTFILAPPRGTIVTCQAIGGSGSMFLRFSEEPNLSAGVYDCSVLDLARSCTLTTPGTASPRLFIVVEALDTAIGSLELDCQTDFFSNELEEGVETQPFDLFDFASKTFELPVSRGDNITCELTADDPDTDSVDFFLNFDEPLTTFDAECFGLSFQANEVCSVENTGSSTVLYVVVTSLRPTATGIILVCSITSPAIIEGPESMALEDGIASDLFSLQDFEVEVFTLDVAPGARTTCGLNGVDGNADLYLRYNEPSDIDQALYDCESRDIGSTESCTVRDSGFGGTLFATVEAFNTFTDLTITCTSENIGPPLMLTSGEESGPYSLTESEIIHFSMQVEPGERVVCTTTGGLDGDTDLIMRLRQEVNIADFDFDCYSQSVNSEESCSLVVPEGVSAMWIALLGFSATNGVFLTCTKSIPPPPPPPIELMNGVTAPPISSEIGLSQRYTYAVEPGTRVTCLLEPTTMNSFGDADLYMRFDEEPDLDNFVYDCVSADTDSIESCSLDIPQGVSSIWATIQAYTTFADVAITCSSEDKVALIQLFDGIPSEPLSLPFDVAQAFQLVAPPGPSVVCETRLLVDDEFSDADLYIRVDLEPDLEEGLYDCSSLSLESTETCILSGISSANTLFVTIYAFTAFNDLILTCSSFSGGSVLSAIQLSDEVPSDPFALNTNQIQDFIFETPDMADAECMIEGTTGDADLFLRWAEPPNLFGRFPLFDCSSERDTSVETCVVTNPGSETTLYARVFAFEAFNDVVITCSFVTSIGGPGATPAPVDATTPAPVDTTTPAPVVTSTPAPVVTSTPAPVVTSTPAPTPSPVATPGTDAPVAETPAETDAPTASPSGGVSHAFGCWSSFLGVGIAILGFWNLVLQL